MNCKMTLLEYSPDLASQWHPTKNGTRTPKEMPYKTQKKVWWLCPECGQEWEASVANRTNGTGCPQCNRTNQTLNAILQRGSLATNYPDLAKQWHPTKNGVLTPDQVSAKCSKKVWWVGPCGHEWNAIIANRTTRDTSCPICKHRILIAGENDLLTTNPSLAAQWHPTKNENFTPDMVTEGSSKRAWWLCPTCGNEWNAIIVSRSKGANCRVCAMKKSKNGAKAE